MPKEFDTEGRLTTLRTCPASRTARMLERIPCIRSTTSHRSRFQERGIRTLESVCKAAHRGRRRLWGSWRVWREMTAIKAIVPATPELLREFYGHEPGRSMR